MNALRPTWALLLPSCLVAPGRYDGEDDPTFDHDRDTYVEAPDDGRPKDCAPQDPTRFPTAAEFCDGRWNDCQTRDTWSIDQEVGHVTFFDERGRPTDLTRDWQAAVESGVPIDVQLTEPGTLSVCAGTWPVALVIHSPDVVVQGLGTPTQPATLSGAEQTTVVEVSSTGSVVLRDLTVSNGRGTSDRPGGGIWARQGQLTVEDTVVSHNEGPGGAGILVETDVVLSNVEVQDNEATESHGGGVLVKEAGELRADGLRAHTNHTGPGLTGDPDAPRGGSLANLGFATIQRSTFDGSVAVGGGAIYNTGMLTLVDSALRGNNSGEGGAISNAEGAELAIARCTLSSNNAGFTGDGGGLFNAGELTITDSDIVNNWTGDRGGGVFNAATGDLDVSGSNLASNFGKEGGNFADEGRSTWTNSVLTAGIAQTGGGLYTNAHAVTTLEDVAIWSNRARPDNPDSGEVEHGGGGVAVRGGTLVCTTTDAFRGPDAEPGAVFVANTSDVVSGGGMVVAQAVDLETFVNFDGCGFGEGDRANTPIPVLLSFRGVEYALDGFDGNLVCDIDRCTCDGEPCPEVLPE